MFVRIIHRAEATQDGHDSDPKHPDAADELLEAEYVKRRGCFAVHGNEVAYTPEQQ